MVPVHDGGAPLIATWAWDRLFTDPLPGPRGFGAFKGLRQPAPDVNLISATTTVRPPAGSSLPPLSGALNTELALLDPYQGCRGLVRQLKATAEWCGADQLTVVDVGGDVLARPGDRGLRSPLADVTTLVAVANTSLPSELVILGIGCDGELAPHVIKRRLSELGASGPTPIDPDRVRRVLRILEWHPSEATALLAMTTLGYRGTVEIRDRGFPVTLEDDTGATWRLPATKALPPQELVAAIAATSSLPALENIFREAFSVDEIDYERRKAAEIATGGGQRQLDSGRFLAEAAECGAEGVTRRRSREAIGTVPEDYARALLVPTGLPRSAAAGGSE
jgi:hypothetical protein